MSVFDEVLTFWFAPPGPGDNGEMRRRWFVKDPEFDAAIRTKFGAAIERALNGEFDAQVTDARAALGALILLDQFPRNVFRGTTRAFAGDGRALALAKRCVAQGWVSALAPIERLFVCLPFEHSEILADQDQGVALCAALPPAPWRDNVIDFANRHRDVIRRYGRFPHRNAALGRVSTAAEQHYLAQPGAGF